MRRSCALRISRHAEDMARTIRCFKSKHLYNVKSETEKEDDAAAAVFVFKRSIVTYSSLDKIVDCRRCVKI